MMKVQIGEVMYQWAKDLFPINRSLTGDGVRQTLHYIKEELPELRIHSVESGTKVFDWEVPDEWNISTAFIEDESGNRIVDFADNNLHVLGYSIPVDLWLDFETLDEHLYSLPEQPTAIPYVTSYYKRCWGFCLSDNKRKVLDKNKKYHVVIHSTLKSGVLNYGELLISGEEKKEILLSTYICHPSMANNELSGPVVAMALAKSILDNIDRRYTYRILFLPETIGAITYLSYNYQEMCRNTIAGFVLTCVGDERTYSFMPSRLGNTLADNLAKHVLKHSVENFVSYNYSQRGSDERQYCSPGIDLPVVSIMRSKYAEYPEYHTSLDNLDLISAQGLKGAFDIIHRAIFCLENNYIYKTMVLCEPQLGKRGLYPTVSTKETVNIIKVLRDVITYSDGNHSLLDIAELIDEPLWDLIEQAGILQKHGIIEVLES